MGSSMCVVAAPRALRHERAVFAALAQHECVFSKVVSFRSVERETTYSIEDGAADGFPSAA